jgi:hypothetical protein
VIDKCENCGARLAQRTPTPDGGTENVCAYCGARNYQPAPLPPRPAPRRDTPPEVAFVPPTRSSPIPLIVVAMLVVGGAAFAVMRAKSGSSLLASMKPSPSWDEVGGPPVVTTIHGSEAIVGRLRDVGSGDQLFVGAFDGTTLAERWRTKPLGTYSDGYRATRFAVSGAHVAVSDFHSVVHVLDLETGGEQRVVTLTDKVESMCPQPQERVWLEQIDKRSVMLDLGTGQVTEAAKPPGCLEEKDRFFAREVVRKGKPPLPKIDGFEPTTPLETDGTLVVFGKKSPGTPTPMAIGLDPTTYAVRWRTPLPAVDLATVREASIYKDKMCAVCSDRFVGAYGEGQKKWHVTALDTRSGVRQWDVTLRPIFAVDWLYGIVCTSSRVYVVRMASVDVLDATTGKAIGTIGHETYE